MSLSESCPTASDTSPPTQPTEAPAPLTDVRSRDTDTPASQPASQPARSPMVNEHALVARPAFPSQAVRAHDVASVWSFGPGVDKAFCS